MNPSDITWKWFFSIFVTALVTALLSGIITGILTALYVWKIQRSMGKADNFTESIFPVLRQLEDAKTNEEIIAIYTATRPLVRDAAAKFSRYVSRKHRLAFDVAWRQYCGIQENGLTPVYDRFDYPKDLPKLLFSPDKLASKLEMFRLLNVMIRLAS